jgi:hypothetical protein
MLIIIFFSLIGFLIILLTLERTEQGNIFLLFLEIMVFFMYVCMCEWDVRAKDESQGEVLD